ncbi:MAG: hypothetical protein U9P72_01095 [Campylobacterota bacterium]|nr:hypothetical protein [Campylobacterota bacterium]
MKRSIKIIIISELLIILSSFISFEFYINLQVAFLSSLFVILGSSFAYKRMINNQIDSKMIEEKRDLLDEIEDPHGLYDNEPINDTPAEELDLKTIVKEEKAKIKTLSVDSIKHGARGSVSAFRLVPYVFLVLGFIALKNNDLLVIAIYLPSLLVGIVVGSMCSKDSLN